MNRELPGSGGARTPNEARERAALGAETEAATEAVSKARGVSFSHTRKDRPVEVRRVREMARQRVEKVRTTSRDPRITTGAPPRLLHAIHEGGASPPD